MDTLAQQIINDAEALYASLVQSHSRRLQNIQGLKKQFFDAVKSWQNGNDPTFQGVQERINEIGALGTVLNDQSVSGCQIQYEPMLGTTQKSMDLLLTQPGKPNRYIEIKTIKPLVQSKDKGRNRHQTILDHIAEDTNVLIDGINLDDNGNIKDDPNMGDYLGRVDKRS
ncbi:MAG: hypothetical protein MRY59_12385 [Aquisalinus sp.]|nr:hypothetical protein [Aquisalinus sp.]